MAMPSPMKSDMAPLAGCPVEAAMAAKSPRQASQKYSKLEKLSAISANAGAAKINISAPNAPPSADATKPTPKAVSA